MASSDLQDSKAGAITPPASGNGKAEEVRQADAGGFRVRAILRIVGGLLVLNAVLSYLLTNDSFWWGQRPWFTKPARVSQYLRGPVLLDDIQLRAYDGSDPQRPIYVALNGTIYDVTPGARVYGPGGSYHALAGKDASRSFITTCIAEDDNPDLRGAEWTYVPKDVPGFNEPATGAQKTYREQELRKARKQVQAVLEGWKSVFSGQTGKDYHEVGKVNRPVDWQSSLPLKELCEQAQKKRPAAKQETEKAAGAAHRHYRK